MLLRQVPTFGLSAKETEGRKTEEVPVVTVVSEFESSECRYFSQIHSFSFIRWSRRHSLIPPSMLQSENICLKGIVLILQLA